MTLDEFLKEERNSVFREKLVNYWFFYQVKLEAAKNKNDIQIFIPEIDRNGFDVILDDLTKLVPYQLKVIQKSSRTQKWEISKNLIRPKPYLCSLLGYEESPEGDGEQGGFVLIQMTIDEQEISKYEYYYTDCFILKAFEEKLITFKGKDWSSICDAILIESRKGSRLGKIKMRKSAMVKVTNIDKLLALSDISTSNHNQWQNKFITYLKNKTNSNLRGDVLHALNEIIDDNRFKIGT